MAKMKKIIGIVLALAMVFSVATCALSASAATSFPKAGIDIDWTKLGNLLPSNWFGKGDNDDADQTPAVTDPATDDAQQSADPMKDREPLIGFHFDLDGTIDISYGIHIGHAPTTTTATIEEPTIEAPTETTTETPVVTVDANDETPLANVDVTDTTPLADVEQIANTGDAGVAAIVALSAVSAAAFVVAKKK